MANWNKLTARQFSAIKMLLKGGATQVEAADYMQVSSNTVYWVGKAETYEDYLHNVAERQLERKQVAAIKAKQEKAQKAKEVAEKVGAVPASQLAKQIPQVVEHKQTVQITATHYMTEELREIKEVLKCISNKLAFIVNDLYGEKDVSK